MHPKIIIAKSHVHTFSSRKLFGLADKRKEEEKAAAGWRGGTWSPKSNSQFYSFLKGSKPFAAENDLVFLCKTHHTIPRWEFLCGYGTHCICVCKCTGSRPFSFIHFSSKMATRPPRIEKANLCPNLFPFISQYLFINILYKYSFYIYIL